MIIFRNMKKILILIRSKQVLIFITALFLILTSFYFLSNSHNIRFVDEEENIVGGSYLLKGERLYSDIFLQHQPLTYIFSSILQKLINVNSIYLLIKTHRIAIVIWSFVWSIFLVIRFGSPLVGFIFLYELLKIYLFGNFFLAESLSVYPLVYLFSIFLFKVKKIRYLEIILIGASFSTCIFLLSNLWPVLFVLFFLMWKYRYFNKNNIYYFIFGFFSVTLIALITSSIKGYFYDLFYVNFKYYVPHPSSGADTNLFKPFLLPIISFFTKVEKTTTLYSIQISVLAIFASIISLVQKKNRGELLIPLVLLGLTGIRYVEPGLQFYRGFHLLPWFAVLILLVFYYSTIAIRLNPKIKILTSLLILILIYLSITGAFKQLFVKRDINTDNYINYSRQFDYGEVVKIMKTKEDRLLVIPDDMLIYWQANINHASKYIFFYDWMYDTPEIAGDLNKLFINSPPQFIYCNCSNDKLEKYTTKYIRIKKDGKPSNLYVLDSVIKDLTKEKWDSLNYYNVSI